MLYYIEKKSVTKEEFETFLSKLSSEQEDWACLEEQDGGRVIYYLKDKNGKKFRVEEKSGQRSEKSIATDDGL